MKNIHTAGKKLLSAFLVLCMVLTLGSSVVLADPDTGTAGSVSVQQRMKAAQEQRSSQTVLPKNRKLPERKMRHHRDQRSVSRITAVHPAVRRTDLRARWMTVPK